MKNEKTIPAMPESVAEIASQLDVLKKAYEWNGYNLWLKAAATVKYPRQLGMMYAKKRGAWYCNAEQLAKKAERDAAREARKAEKAAQKKAEAEKKKAEKPAPKKQTAEKKTAPKKPTAEKKTEKPPVPAPAPIVVNKKARKKNNDPAPHYCGGIQNNETKQFTLFYSHSLKSWASVEKQLKEKYALDGDTVTKNATCKTDDELCAWIEKSNEVVLKAEKLGYTFGGIIEVKPRSDKKDLRLRMADYAQENEFFLGAQKYAIAHNIPVNMAIEPYTQEYMAA